jgi:hypothetical protein
MTISTAIKLVSTRKSIVSEKSLNEFEAIPGYHHTVDRSRCKFSGFSAAATVLLGKAYRIG